MKDKSGKIIYIGKALNLKNRVRSYFRYLFENKREGAPSPRVDLKLEFLVKCIRDFETILTDTETEALILESILIKRHQPQYNVRLKDDKSFPYITITTSENFPRLFSVRKIRKLRKNFAIIKVAEKKSGKDDHGLKDMAKKEDTYFGPYTDGRYLKKTINLLHEIFKIRNCTLGLPKQKLERPCLEYDIGRCSAPCVKFISESAYQERVLELMNFLSGDFDQTISKIKKEIKNYSDSLNFEKAARMRDLLEGLKSLNIHQKVDLLKNEDRDIISFARNLGNSIVVQFKFRNGNLVERSHYVLTGEESWPDSEFMEAFLREAYLDQNSLMLPGIITMHTAPQRIKIYQGLINQRSSHPVKLEILKRSKSPLDKKFSGADSYNQKIREHEKTLNEKNIKGLIELGIKNALMILNEEDIKKNFYKKKRALSEIQDKLKLARFPEIIVCIDISNLGGTNIVASLVSMRSGAFHKNYYRRFRIKSVSGKPDDVKAIKEVVARYLKRIKDGKEDLPDLMLIDGGTGQLNAALYVIYQSEMEKKLTIASIAKKFEEIYIPGSPRPLPWKKDSRGLLLLQKIRNEAHRFAISYHRNLRSKESLKSILDEVRGIGEKVRIKVFREISKLDESEKLSLARLKTIPGIGDKLAKKIIITYRTFQRN